MPNLNELVEHVTQSIGTPEFGKPRLPEGMQIRFQPIECVQTWGDLKNNLLEAIDVPVDDWALAYGLALQNLINQSKDIVEPSKAAIIIMECAMPMSKILI